MNHYDILNNYGGGVKFSLNLLLKVQFSTSECSIRLQPALLMSIVEFGCVRRKIFCGLNLLKYVSINWWTWKM